MYCVTIKLYFQWFPEVSQNCPKVPIILVGTKWDLKSDDEIVARLEKRNLSPITYEQVNHKEFHAV